MGKVPAHLIEKTVRFCHTIKLMFVLFQKIHIALFWNKLQQLIEEGKKNRKTHFHLSVRVSVKDGRRIYPAVTMFHSLADQPLLT